MLPAPITRVWALSDRYITSVKPPDGWETREVLDDSVFRFPERWEHV